ncbi:cell division protein SepF [Heyndrickxia acidiproducens]|jgi:cell division inhibitor SepF|uniref:cell division protein SepF n=1 Tax=Heyndrickxia acidiproducens TaxID=1121084 RepID=UPI00037090D6|nr:cell division protein SepF [Heyndrickxia acidiproducens]
MGLKTKFKSFFLLDDEYEDREQEMMEKEYEPEPESQAQKQIRGPRQNVVSLQSVQKSSKVILVEPRVYADAQEIADHLKNRRAVVVNLQSMPHDQAKRIVDFLSGTVYAIAGDIQRVGNNIFLCTPDNVEVSGKISEFLQEQDFNDTRWS